MLKNLLFFPLLLAFALPVAAQTNPPVLDAQPFKITDGDGKPLTNGAGEVLDASVIFTPSGVPGDYVGASYLNGKKHEEICVYWFSPGHYIYFNHKKKTYGFIEWNAGGGYFDHWSSYNGGTRRRLYPSK